MDQEHKVAFIGPSKIHEAFKGIDPTWDMQSPMTTLDDFSDDIGKDEDVCEIAKDTKVIIYFSRLYNQDPDLFSELVAFTAPYSVTCILIPRSDEFQKNKIEGTIREKQRQIAKEDDTYNSNTPFFFVEYENAQAEIFDSIYSFCNSSIIDPEITDIVNTMLPNNEIPKIEDYGDYEEEKEIIIPQRDNNATGKVITVTSAKGGSGKSSIAIMLASYIRNSSVIAAQEGKIPEPLKVLVIDLDVRAGKLGFLNGAIKPNIMSIFMKGSTPTAKTIKEGIYTNTRTKIDYIFAARTPRFARNVPDSFYVPVIQIAQSMYDVVILDTSVEYQDPLLEKVAYPMADHILYVSDFCRPSIYDMARWISEMTERPEAEPGENIDREKIYIILNKGLSDVNMEISQIEKAARGLPILAVYPSAPSLVTYCSNTSSLDAVLHQPLFNEATKEIVDELFPDIPLTQPPTN